MSNQEGNCTTEPGYEAWGELLDLNLACRPHLDERLGGKTRREIREQVVALAYRYSQELESVARSLGISRDQPLVQPFSHDESRPLILSGHQPIIFHSGLLRKATMLARIARDKVAIGVHIAIDTDEGQGGELVWPRISAGALELRRGSLVEATGTSSMLYSDQRLKPRDALRDIFAEIVSDLRQSNRENVAGRVEQAADIYSALAGQPVVAANTIVRWVLGGAGYYELPLSVAVTKTNVCEVITTCIQDASHLHESYNTCLNEYRREHRIDNQANPFPNLKSRSTGEMELPFWSVQGGHREAVYSFGAQQVAAKVEGYYAPRASMTTLLLRAYCSDLFIHGLGGATYDRFVDRFAQSYLGVTLPRFVVATETRYLFPEQVGSITRELELAKQFKEMISRTELFLGRGIFSESEETQLMALLEDRDRLRVQIQGAQGDDKRTVALALNEANRRVRSCIEAGSLKDLLAREPHNQAVLGTWSCREFPFFMHG